MKKIIAILTLSILLSGCSFVFMSKGGTQPFKKHCTTSQLAPLLDFHMGVGFLGWAVTTLALPQAYGVESGGAKAAVSLAGMVGGFASFWSAVEGFSRANECTTLTPYQATNEEHNYSPPEPEIQVKNKEKNLQKSDCRYKFCASDDKCMQDDTCESGRCLDTDCMKRVQEER